jgi:hypothetical protein
LPALARRVAVAHPRSLPPSSSNNLKDRLRSQRLICTHCGCCAKERYRGDASVQLICHHNNPLCCRRSGTRSTCWPAKLGYLHSGWTVEDGRRCHRKNELGCRYWALHLINICLNAASNGQKSCSTIRPRTWRRLACLRAFVAKAISPALSIVHSG